MKPVDQIRTGHGRGQCTEASIASLLEVPLEAVPDIWAGPDVPADAPLETHQPTERLHAMWNWLKREHGVQLCGIAFTRGLPLREAWKRAVEAVPFVGSDLIYHLAAGPNPDGVSHYVVCLEGVLAHDPNPRRRGIVEARYIQWLVPLDRVPADALELPAAEWIIEVPTTSDA